MHRWQLLVLSSALLACPPAEDRRSEPEVARMDDEGVATRAPDNTGINERDRSGGTVTPMDQGENEADRAITRRIREAIMADASLSMDAKNVKVVTVNGMVTLRGPVESAAEKAAVAAAARSIAGAGKVDDQLEVEPDSGPQGG